MKGVCKYGYKIYTAPRPHSGAASRRSWHNSRRNHHPAKDKPQEGEVISVGKGKTNDEGKLFPLAVREGDRILFGKYSGTEIKIDGEDFLIMKEEEVLGLVTGAAKKETVGAKK